MITIIKFRKNTLYILLFLGVLGFLSDQSSVKLFKDVFERLRPCHNPLISDVVHIINGRCGGKYGFVSSHAANSFAIAVFMGALLKPHYKRVLVFTINMGINSFI